MRFLANSILFHNLLNIIFCLLFSLVHIQCHFSKKGASHRVNDHIQPPSSADDMEKIDKIDKIDEIENSESKSDSDNKGDKSEEEATTNKHKPKRNSVENQKDLCQMQTIDLVDSSLVEKSIPVKTCRLKIGRSSQESLPG